VPVPRALRGGPDIATHGLAARHLHARRRRIGGLAELLTTVALAAAACSAFGGPTFAPTGACVADGRAPGAYPDLEARVPRTINGRPATSIDSGRDCTADTLGSLATHGIQELRFAGATWDEGDGNGVSIALLAVPAKPLPVAWVEEFYELGAANAKHTGNFETTRPTYPGVGTVYRLDTLNDLSFQTVVVWRDGDEARVVIVATQVDPSASRQVHDARVAEAVGAAGTVAQPSPGCGCSQGPVLPSAT
jgi:hypothetical protein